MPELSTTEIVLIGILVVVEMGVLVIGLVDILKRRDEEVVGGRRWVWILVMLFVNIIGPIIYLVAGRRPRAAVDPTADHAPAANRAKRAVDALYGQDGNGTDRE